MLAFDIETTGLDPMRSEVTCLCLYDPDEGIERTFMPPLGDDLGEAFRIMDTTSVLCAFNGAQFDIPFLQTRYGLQDARVGAWRLKLNDLYESCYQAFGKAFSLNAVLRANGIESKTGDGCGAIELAQAGRWAELGEYCMQDTMKTHAVTSLARKALPVRGQPRPVFMRDGAFTLS